MAVPGDRLTLAPARRKRPPSRLRPVLVAALLRLLSGLLSLLSWRAAPRCRQLARACCRDQGMNLAECLHLMRRDCAAVASHVELRGWEEIERAQGDGRPIVILAGHCGNWELLAAALTCRGVGMAVVARALDEPRLQGLLAGLRGRFGTVTIERGSEGAARQILGTLRRGGALGMLIDQDTKVDGVWVPFFGRPAFTPVGAAKIALRQRARVIAVFIERLPDGSHLARAVPPLDLPADPREATARMTA